MAASDATGLECSVCTDVLQDPHALPCGHSFCGPPKNCLEGVRHGPTSTKCSNCNAVFHSLKISDLNPLYGIRDALARLSPETYRDVKNKLWPKCDVHKRDDICLWCNDCKITMCIKCIENDHAAHRFKSYRIHMKERAAELLPKLQSAKSRIQHLDEEITKQQLKIDNLWLEIYVREELKEKMKCKKERFSRFVETENDLELFVNENKEPSSNILHNVISDQKLMDLESSSVKFAFEIKFENILNLQNGCHTSDWRPYGENSYAVKLQYITIQGNPWLGIFLYVSKIDQNANFGWEVPVKYRISILNNMMEKTMSLILSRPKVLRFDEKVIGWKKFVEWATLLNTKLGWHSNHIIRIRIEILR